MTASVTKAKPARVKGVRTYFTVRCNVSEHGRFIQPDGRLGERHLFGSRKAAEDAAVQHASRFHVVIEALKAVVKKRVEYDITEVAS